MFKKIKSLFSQKGKKQGRKNIRGNKAEARFLRDRCVEEPVPRSSPASRRAVNEILRAIRRTPMRKENEHITS